jgi:hypothetical protein
MKMAELRTHFVVRRRAPLRGLVIALAVTVLATVCLYAIYELGRFDAGYDRQAVSQQRIEFEVKLQKLEDTHRQLRTQLAELDTVRVGRDQERRELARTIGDLQAQAARQTQDLAFYRGIVAQQVDPKGAPEGGVYIQQLRIRALPEPLHFEVHFALLQGHGESTVSGTVIMHVEGAADGQPSTLDIPAGAGKDTDRPFSFRYFQELDQELTLPSGFRAERLHVEVRTNRKGVEPIDQSFPWRVEPS